MNTEIDKGVQCQERVLSILCRKFSSVVCFKMCGILFLRIVSLKLLGLRSVETKKSNLTSMEFENCLLRANRLFDIM